MSSIVETKSSKSTTMLIDALTARTRFGEIMQKAENEQTRFVVSRRGKAKVVIMSVEDYLRNVVKTPDVLVKLQMDARKAGMDKITDEEIDAEIQAYRKSKLSK
jgi:prevent-host-death family protein